MNNLHSRFTLLNIKFVIEAVTFKQLLMLQQLQKMRKSNAYKSNLLPANLQIILVPYISQKKDQRWAAQVMKVAPQAFPQAPKNNYDASATARVSVTFSKV